MQSRKHPQYSGEKSPDPTFTVFVTGAGGYVGTVLVPKLLAAGYRVRALDLFLFGQELLPSHPHLELITADSRDYEPKLLEGVDAVIDLVALSNDPTGELFTEATWQINHSSRRRTAQWARRFGVHRYILPSSCSLYGFQETIVHEASPLNPLTTYAKANRAAEESVLSLAGGDFAVTALRQSTLFGASPRMRFDLAINGMTEGAWSRRQLPLMRDGSQYRPMLHVEDTCAAMMAVLKAPTEAVNGEIFNVGGASSNYQIGELGQAVAKSVEAVAGEPIPIEWYGDPDERSYRVDFSKIARHLDWQPQWSAAQGVADIVARLADGRLVREARTITLDWYQELLRTGRIDTQLHLPASHLITSAVS